MGLYVQPQPTWNRRPVYLPSRNNVAAGTGALASPAAAIDGVGLLTPYRRVIRPATILSAQASTVAGTATVS